MEMRWAIWGRRTSIRERTSMIAVRGSMIAMRGSMIATRETMRTTLTSIRTVYYTTTTSISLFLQPTPLPKYVILSDVTPYFFGFVAPSGRQEPISCETTDTFQDVIIVHIRFLISVRIVCTSSFIFGFGFLWKTLCASGLEGNATGQTHPHSKSSLVLSRR
jgi:hypothetical protein